LGLSLLFAFGLDYILARLRERPRAVRMAAGMTLGALLAVELVPAPRRLYSAAIPDVYRLIATTDETTGRLLELPTGILDGTEMLGSFNASSEYFQTLHRRPMIGGYLSRVSRWRKNENMRSPMLKVLIALSAGTDQSPADVAAAFDDRDAFLARSCVRYVIINKGLTSSALRSFAVDALDLTLAYEDAQYALLTPADPPPCESYVSAR